MIYLFENEIHYSKFRLNDVHQKYGNAIRSIIN